MSWMIYGASGYSGELIAQKAVERGHKPIVAGRSKEKVQPLAERLGVPWTAFPLDDAAAVEHALKGVKLVVHAAGPFVHTAGAMQRACLATGAHYLDITGEIGVFQQSRSLDGAAREKGIVILSGVGFDVVPTDCLARYVADAVPDARELEIAFATHGSPSAGTAKSAIEGLAQGNFARRGGKLTPIPVGAGGRDLRFLDGTHFCVPIPWGDLETAFQTTGIPDITTYMAMPPQQAMMMRLSGPLMKAAMGVPALKNLALDLAGKYVKGPDEERRKTGRTHVWARASDGAGKEKQAWLEVAEGYAFTAASAVRCAEEVLAHPELKGALTPARAFGADFVLTIEGSRRTDSL